MFFEVKVSDPVAKSVNNKIVQFYPIRSEIVGNNIKDDDDDDDQMGLVEYKHAGKLMAAFTSLRRFSQFRELHAFSSSKGARLPPSLRKL